ncbi:hypothetical protein [Devosia sp.]|uniref:hypothetical protein n=1 Tax=Devosia sp. TaxID=1871048 RepID=UPI003A907B63
MRHDPLAPDDTLPAAPPEPALPAGHNGGPPLDDDPRPWGANGIGHYFAWTAAKKKALDAPREVVLMRARRAAALGLTYDEYTFELLERGRWLGPADTDRIAAIKRRRPL